MKIGQFTNKESGDKFTSCIFLKDNNPTFVRFSQKLGELSPREIAQQKYELQVVLLDSGHYTLCRKGDPGAAWQDVDLGI